MVRMENVDGKSCQEKTTPVAQKKRMKEKAFRERTTPMVPIENMEEKSLQTKAMMLASRLEAYVRHELKERDGA